MKTRLPKALLAAVITILTYSTTIASADDAVTNTFIDVGKPGIGLLDPAPSWQGAYVYEEDNLTLGTGSAVGIKVGGQLYSITDSDVWDKKEKTYNGYVTKNFQVKGKLTIENDAQISLGGHYQAKSSDAEYTGIIAEEVVVNGTGNVTHLKSQGGYIGDLTVNSGNVKLHTETKQGNSFMKGSMIGSKQVRITDSISMNGGDLTIGQGNGPYITTSKHYIAGFGSSGSIKFNITQTGGAMKVYGDTIATSTFEINQNVKEGEDAKEANLFITDNLVINGAAKMTIQQSNDEANLIIGRLVSESKSASAVDIEQTGSGNIYLANGTDFGTSNSKVSIAQSGGGDIYIGGGIDRGQTGGGYNDSVRYNFTSTGTTYSIKQTGEGGNLVLKAGSKEALHGNITASSLHQNATDATITIEAGAKLNVEGSVAYDGDNVTSGAVIDNGTLENNGTLTVNELVMSNGAIVNNGAMVVESLTLTNGTITLGKDATLTITQSLTFVVDWVDGDVTAPSINIVTQAATPAMLTLNAVTGDSNTGLIFSDGATAEVLFSQEVLNKVFSYEKFEDSLEINLSTMVTVDGQIDQDLVDELGITVGIVAGGVDSYVAVTEIVQTEGSYTVTLQHVPEPATATLSLLALAGLCARRRRH